MSSNHEATLNVQYKTTADMWIIFYEWYDKLTKTTFLSWSNTFRLYCSCNRTFSVFWKDRTQQGFETIDNFWNPWACIASWQAALWRRWYYDVSCRHKHWVFPLDQPKYKMVFVTSWIKKVRFLYVAFVARIFLCNSLRFPKSSLF